MASKAQQKHIAARLLKRENDEIGVFFLLLLKYDNLPSQTH